MAKTSYVNKQRLFIAFAIIVVLIGALMVRLAMIQVLQNDYYKKGAMEQQTRDIPIVPKRGAILDRNGMKLAYSITTYNVWARPAEIKDMEATVKELTSNLAVDAMLIEGKLHSKKTLVKIASGVNKATADMIKNKRLKGVWVAADSMREYPYNYFASYVIGHTTSDNAGIAGIEQAFEKELKGKEGRMVVSTDVDGRELPYGQDKEIPPVEGRNVVLTIDEVIQHFTEKAVEETYGMYQAKRVMAIVMDPKTGDILSMAAKPNYNPNNPRDISALYSEEQVRAMTNQQKVDIWSRLWRNPIVNDTYEPGSTFKLITTTAGLEKGVAAPNSPFYCKGYTDVYGTRINCWSRSKPHGQETLTSGLENSCNPVFMEIGARLKKRGLYEYIEKFGLTAKTGITMPAESRSIYLPEKKVGPVDLATMSFGHGISVTPLQMVTAVSAIANDGVLMKPRVVKQLTDENGRLVQGFDPVQVRRVMSEKTSQQMRLMMESVVVNGSGKKAYIPGIRIGGKTGTTEKMTRGAYSKDLNFSSFVGIAPVDDPKIVVLIIVDEPKKIHFGSVVAAPCARAIMVDTLRYLKVEPKFSSDVKVAVPSLKGMTVQKASQVLDAAGLKVSVSPAGQAGNNKALVVKQIPAAGKKVTEGSDVVLYVEE